MLAFIENLFRGPDLIVLLLLGLLIFGKRLPEVGRGLGRSIVEFRKGMKGVQDEVDDAVNRPPAVKPPAEIPHEPAKPPLTSTGEDARVSRSDKVDSGPSEPSPMP